MQRLWSFHFLGLALAAASDLDFEQGAFFLLQREISKQPAKQASLQVAGPNVGHYWSSRGRDEATSSSASFTAPSNFSAGPSWVWENDLNEMVRHSPLIDADKNVFVMTATRLRKLSSDGDLLWTWQADSDRSMAACPVLHRSSILTLLRAKDLGEPILVSVDTASGLEEWRQLLKNVNSSQDSPGMKIFNDTVYVPARTNIDDGSDTVLAVNASNGKKLWDYVTESVLWNFAPAVDNEGLVFAGTCGSVERLSAEGKLLWRAGPRHPGEWCGVTGGTLGPNGVFYTAYQENDLVITSATTFPASMLVGQPQRKIVAYNMTDGSMIWEKPLDYHVGQHPAVGKLGPDGPLAVLVPMGDMPTPPKPKEMEDDILKTVGGSYRNKVLALDAATGATLWRSEDRPYHATHGAGETEKHNAADGQMCLPDAQGIPVVAGDGTVYTSSSHHGDLTAFRDLDGDGIISPTEASVFQTKQCFLNSPSIAPGMLVAAPCWGPVYVFKS